MSKRTLILTVLIGAVAVAAGVLMFLPQPQAQEPIKIPPKIVIERQKPESSVFFTPSTPPATFEKDEITIETRAGKDLTFDVELALWPQQQARGLMMRTEMADNAGMLFVFDDTAMRKFWMKDTLIPLDMLFISADGVILHIHHNAKPQDLTTIPSEHPAKAVLELNGGAADKMGIKEGDQVWHPYFRNGVGAQ